MKKLFGLKRSFWVMTILAVFFSIGQVSAQPGKKLAAPVPDNVNAIIQNSCMPCHGSSGGVMPRTKVDFSKWTEYTAANASQKAAKICAVVTDGSMPPKAARDKKPGTALTKEQIDLVCQWAGTLKPQETKK